jgi:hypothetical protein
VRALQQQQQHNKANKSVVPPQREQVLSTAALATLFKLA